MHWLVVIGGYLLGSLLPGDWIVRRRTGLSADEQGDNPGGAGTWRLAGPAAGVLVTAFDLVKGAIPVALAQKVGMTGAWMIAAAAAPVAGHNWPWYRRWRGGRGLAAATGALFCLDLAHVLPGYVLGAIAAWRRGWVPMVGVVAFPVGLLTMWAGGAPALKIQAALAVMLLVALRQASWVKARIRAGQPILLSRP
ncbi:glycerol-3-phosphate acyltransferase [Carboxydochorda subterranea]|uniref:Glycerol-3-phosphate acyltransferase n=1 Tax=Carboxydichorda subterranea TaxID=3109565 RepID=A0ABZ1BYH1_9FIRM|nr:glycerol-3-phosphate acyltransferase [Limnochorda sp. L945t]WRP17137.1 glycerol-3-phosphate acyltransferase [Limnochorda sp. L945t]